MSAVDELREARLDLLRAQTRHESLEADYAELKLDELKRETAVAKNTGAEENIFTFASEINEKTVYQAIQTLGIFSRRNPGCHITMYLTSNGGQGMAGFALFDYIRELRAKGHTVTIHALGYAMSMAVTLLQAADERVLSKNGFILIHEASFDPGHGSYSDHADQVKRTEMLQDKVFAALAERSTLSVAQIKRKATKNEWQLDAEEALRVGLIDRIS